MIGQDYFDLRSRLGASLFALKALVSESPVEADSTLVLDNLISGLKDPFVFVVAGEVNVGKSTFLNALFGTDFSKTGVMPTTDKIFFFKHGDALRRVPVTRTLEEVHVPADFLRDFHIVDTPGTNSIENEHQEITERFVPMADLVIFVFSAMNPWGASAWQFLEKVHTFWMRNVIFVLQQSDLREPEEIASILAYMRQLSQQRFGREFPTFAISAKKAYLARSSGLDRDRLLAESGFLRLEEHISRSIAGGGSRVGKLSSALRIAREIHGEILTRATGRIAQREEKSGMVSSLASSLLAQSERTLSKVSDTIDATAADYEAAAATVLAPARRMLTAGAALKSAFDARRPFEGLEKQFVTHLLAASKDRWERAAAVIEDDYAVAARHLDSQFTSTLKMQLRDDVRPDPGLWQGQQRKFLTRVNSILQRVVSSLEVEKLMTDARAAARSTALWQVFLLISSVVAAGACALVGRPWIAGGVLGAGLLTFFVLQLVNARRLTRTRRLVELKIAEGPPELKRQLGERVRDDIQALYDAFGRLLLPIREKLTEQEKRHHAVDTQITDLTRTFAELEVALRSAGAPPSN